MKLTAQQAIEIIDGEHDDWQTVDGSFKIIETRRWVRLCSVVAKHTLSEKFYRFTYELPVMCHHIVLIPPTEDQDYDPFCGAKEYSPEEVGLVEKVVKVWTKIKNETA